MKTPLNETEIQDFFKNIASGSLVLEADRIKCRGELDSLRSGYNKLEEKDLQRIDELTERVCHIYNTLSVWRSVLENGLNDAQRNSEKVCDYVREINLVSKRG